MKNKFFLIILGVLLVVFLTAQLLKNKNPLSTNNKINVTASFYPLAEFAMNVGADKVNVINLTPAGSEPHDFDPSPKDLVQLQKSKLFVYNSDGFEPWVGRVIPDLVISNVLVLNSSKEISLLPIDHHENEEEEEEHETESLYDPHVWLDPHLASGQVDNIKDGLIKVDPENSQYYEDNAALFKKGLKDLDGEFKETLASCKQRDVVVSHNAFSYLAKRYSLNILSISGLSPDEEPSPQKLTEIVKFVKTNNVRYIFFETLVSPRLSETIANETGAKTLVLNPIEGLSEEEINDGKSYISVQRENLLNLKVALNCQ